MVVRLPERRHRRAQRAVLREADALLLGRVTYEGFAAAWPSRSGDVYSDKFNAMPKHVVSTTLRERPSGTTRTIVDGDVAERIRALKADQNLLVWGSPTLVRGLLAERPRRRVRAARVADRARQGQPALRGRARERIELQVAETKQLERRDARASA